LSACSTSGTEIDNQKIMNRILFVLLFLVVFACKEVSFENPQPEGRRALAGVPKTLQGKYLALTEEGRPSKDTVIITPHGYRFGYFDPAERSGKNNRYEEGVLSDTLVLKSYRGYYFLNLNENPEWLLRVLKQEKNGDLIYMTLEEKNADFNDFLKKLSAEIRVDSIQKEDETLYQIDPTPAELIRLIDKGFFSEERLIRIR
jgi:hypothetical protein